MLDTVTPLVKPGLRVLRLRSDKAGATLGQSLRDLGALVDDCLLYHNRPIEHAEKPDFDVVFFASASAVEVYAQQWGPASLKGKVVVAIGKPTLAALQTCGVTPDLIPPQATVESSIEALAAYKRIVDPGDVLNPGKLTRRELPVEPYTFSFNRLIGDLQKTALKDKETLIELLRKVQTCTRCGKCVPACPMAAIVVDVKGKTYRHIEERCIGCGLCALACDRQHAVVMQPVPDYKLPYKSWYSMLSRAVPQMLATSWKVWRQRE